MKHCIQTFIFVSCFAFCTSSFAVSKPAEAVAEETASSITTDQAETKIFLGTVEQLKKGAALFTDGAIYPLVGGDFDKIIGKEVRITGQMIKEENIEKIVVARVQLKQ